MKKPCKKHGRAERDKRGACRECSRARCRKWYHENIDAARESQRRRTRARYARNPEAGRRKQREYIRRNSDRVKELRKARYRKTKGDGVGLRCRSFGITRARFDEMWREQGACCAVCREAFATPSDAGIDHDHATGRVRGLLCNPCNFAIGQMKDDPHRLREAAKYLEER